MSSLSNNQSENQRRFNNNDEDIIDLKQIFSVIAKNWYLFILSIVVCLIIAFWYAYYTSSFWVVQSKILVEDSKNSPSALGGSSGLGAEFGSLFNVKSSADNELQILKSRSLMDKTVKQLQLNVRTYKVTSLKSTEIYQETPFVVKLDYKTDTINYRKYAITIKDNDRYQISNGKDNVNIIAKIGSPVNLKQYTLTLNPVPGKTFKGNYEIGIESVDASVSTMNQSFSVALSDKQSTTIDMELSYPNPKKGEVILEELMDLYLKSNLQNKVEVADNTINFINERIALVRTDLNDIEEQFQQYKVKEGIADIGSQSKVLVASASEYLDKLNQIETQLRVFNELSKLLNNPKNKSTIPSSIVAPTDVAFGQSINSYNNLLIERDRASLAYTPGNPIIENFDQQIETARITLLRSVSSYKSSLETSKAELQKQNGTLNTKLQTVPAKERGFLDFTRKQSLQQDLYLFLLQKKEETAISKTSTISSSRIIDHAKSEFTPSKPKKSTIYLIGLLLGLVLPGIYLFIKGLLNIKVASKQEIAKGTSVTVVGEIGHNATQESLVAIKNSRTVISEQFRSMRTKLNYILDSSKSNVILFTSSMGGEGKSFLSVNLGSALALTGKKVVFMELDLRKPKLSEILGHDHNINGFSNFIVSEFTDINKLIKPLWFDENCSLISSGPIPPNPTELLTNKKLLILIEELKTKFDYIIIDCAPVGLVTDALLLEKYADLTFYVVREGYTYKTQLNLINDLKNNSEVNNLYIVLNDIKTNQDGYSSYGYGLDDNKGSWLKKWRKA